jgi:hypothetical protein
MGMTTEDKVDSRDTSDQFPVLRDADVGQSDYDVHRLPEFLDAPLGGLNGIIPDEGTRDSGGHFLRHHGDTHPEKADAQPRTFQNQSSREWSGSVFAPEVRTQDRMLMASEFCLKRRRYDVSFSIPDCPDIDRESRE